MRLSIRILEDDTGGLLISLIAAAFTGINWVSLRSTTAPQLSLPMGLDGGEEISWRLSSLALSQPLRYEYDDTCKASHT